MSKSSSEDENFPQDLPRNFKSTETIEPNYAYLHNQNFRKDPLPHKIISISSNQNITGPIKPNITNEDSDDDENDNEYKDIKEEIYQPMKSDFTSLKIPCSHEVLLKGHSKTITSISVDQMGMRLATGGYDYKVRLWDFNGMNKNMNSFRIIEPIAGHPIRTLSFSKNNIDLLVIAGNAQPKIINRDGKELVECIKGDMYIKDMNQTKGHISMVYDGFFHPVDKNIFTTCSLDGTIRLWDREMKLINIEQQLTQRQVIKCKDIKGLKTGVTSLAYSNDGNLIIGACLDGSLQGFSGKNHFNRPDFIIQNAHLTNIETTKMIFMEDNRTLISRSLDNTMKIWDIRQPKKPLNIWYNLTNYDPGSKLCLSPDQKLIITGTSIGKNVNELGKVLFYDSKLFDQKAEFSIGNDSVTDIQWHPLLNQLFVGSTDMTTHVFYDPKLSNHGAMLCLSKQPRKIHFDEIEDRQNIIAPHALPLFKDSNGNKRRKYEKMRQDPIISRKPELPLQGPGKGGKIGGASTVTQFLMRSVHEGIDKREDPQKALLKYAEEAEKNPQFVNKAYKETQPKPIFDLSTPDYKEQELLSRLDKICPGCGLKICKCSRNYGEND